MQTSRIIDIVLVTLAVLGSVALLLIVFQPTNVEVNEDLKTGYMKMAGWFGFLLSLPLAFYLVKSNPETGESKLAMAMRLLGVWGTRFCIVFLVYFLFAVGGYLLPNHIVNFSAFEKVRENVRFVEYKLSSTSGSPRFDPGISYWNNEFLVVQKADGTRVPLLIRNWYGTNKLKYSQVVKLIELRGSSLQLVGRRHALGFTYEELRLPESK